MRESAAQKHTFECAAVEETQKRDNLIIRLKTCVLRSVVRHMGVCEHREGG